MTVKVEFDIWVNLACRGAIVFDGFSSIGTVSTIVASYLTEALAMEQIGMIETYPSAPLALVRDGVPLEPMRIYATPEVDGNRNVVVFLSEIPTESELVMPLGHALVKWCLTHGCPLLISPEGVPAEPDGGTPYGVASTADATALLAQTGCRHLAYGTISGVTSVLLSYGREMGLDVVALLAESHREYPDLDGAVRVLECLGPLLPDGPVDTAELQAQARALQTAMTPTEEAEPPAPDEATEGLYT